nr:alpha/beta hydrolase family protein [uncultured Methanoregula sp.]
MDIERSLIPGDSCQIPAILIRPPQPLGAAVIVHGYGGCKEEQLGLGFHVAEAGLETCIIDLRGHGEHPLPLDAKAGDDLAAAIRFCRRSGKVAAIGHSLGGRLALMSNADYRIALSPSLGRTYGERTCEMLKTLRSYRVRPSDLETLLDVQKTLPVFDPASGAGARIIYAERDAPEIAAECTALSTAGLPTIRIPGALHGDIFLQEPVFTAIRDQIREWYGIRD